MWRTIWNALTRLNKRDSPKISVKNSKKIKARKIKLAARIEESAWEKSDDVGPAFEGIPW
jgi:hypothetical protein